MFDFSSLIGPGIDLISNLFGGGNGGQQKQGYEDMMRMIQQGMQQRKDYTNQANNLILPWQQAGQNQLPGYQQNFQRLMDPNFMKQIMGEYQESPFAKMQMEKGKTAMNNAASASGMLGSTDFGKSQADYARDITSQDQQQYLQNRLGMYNQGLGHQQGLVGQGMNAGMKIGGNLMNLGDALAGDYTNMGNAGLGARAGQGMQNQDIMRAGANMGRSIFDYLGGQGGGGDNRQLPFPNALRRFG